MPKAKTKEPDKTAETGQDAGLAARVEKLEEEVRALREPAQVSHRHRAARIQRLAEIVCHLQGRSDIR